jgi:hypothetical protein
VEEVGICAGLLNARCVCGGRNYEDREALNKTLNRLNQDAYAGKKLE